jgi:hypothetical protein
LRNSDDHAVLSNEKKGDSEGHEIVIVMKYPIRYMDISDQVHTKLSDTIAYEEANVHEINMNSFIS